MWRMLFLLFVQSLFQFEVKERKWEGYYREKNYLDISFLSYGCVYYVFAPELAKCIPHLRLFNYFSMTFVKYIHWGLTQFKSTYGPHTMLSRLTIMRSIMFRIGVITFFFALFKKSQSSIILKAGSHNAISCAQLLSNSLTDKAFVWFQHNITKKIVWYKLHHVNWP